jgi:Lysylphosphatidylglycerol synthase TM region
VSRLSDIASWASRHRRLLIAVQLIVLAVFFASLAWALRGTVHSAAHDLSNANLVLFALGCAALAAYYLVFVLGWMWILLEWGVRLPYPAALRAEMISMLAKYIPGAIWAPAARVVAARRAGVTDAALVTSSMLLEAGLSAVAGVIVFVVSLPFVDEVNAPLVPLIVFGAVLAILVQPRVFRPLAHWVLRKVGYRFCAETKRWKPAPRDTSSAASTWSAEKFEEPIQRTLPSTTRSLSAPRVSTIGVTGSGTCIWYTSITSVRRRRSEPSTAHVM